MGIPITVNLEAGARAVFVRLSGLKHGPSGTPVSEALVNTDHIELLELMAPTSGTAHMKLVSGDRYEISEADYSLLFELIEVRINSLPQPASRPGNE